MASQLRQPTPPNGLHPHINAPPSQVHGMNGHMQVAHYQKFNPQHLQQANEQVWIGIGNVQELMGDLEGACSSYENALRHNGFSVAAMNQISCILRTKENFPRAVEYLQTILKLDSANGEVWGSLGHCYLMMEDLQQAYSAYQQALYHLRDPKEPKLWYGIGILYDRYGSLEHAEEAFSQVMRMQPDFEKANEIYFRLGIIYKQQQKFGQSLECFKYIVQDPPRPLTEEDIWFQIGHVHEQQKDYDSAKQAYRRVLDRDPKHAKVLQQLGWLHHQQSNSFSSQEQAIEYLEQSVSSDNSDAQSWYLLGRCYMSQQKYSKAYEAYQQAVYRDGRNPTFWCSIGVLYYQINQYRDALDAYSRAIRLNPYISEVWYDLGTLYESCNNQTTDALDAYQRAADLDPGNVHIKARLQLLRNNQATGIPTQQAAPAPQDVHPQHYQNPGVGAPPGPQWGPAPVQGPPSQAHPHQQQGADFSRRLAAIENPQVQPPNPYDQREPFRGPPPPPPGRQPSPRQEQMRQYQDHRQGPPPRRSPGMAHTAPTYPGQSLPQPSPLQPQQAPQQPTRITNPNFAGAGLATPPAGQPGPIAPPGRGHSPPPQIRPIADHKMQSPGSSMPGFPDRNQGYEPQPPIMNAPPTAALAAAEARDRDDRPPTGFKRGPDHEDDYKNSKKPANGDSRSRLDDNAYRRDSPTNRTSSPQRRSSSEIRREQANQAYHPSEAAHHPPPALPAVPHPPEQHQQPGGPPQHSLPPMNDGARPEEKPEIREGAARKMDIDDDYDNNGDEEKKPRTSPRQAMVNGGAKQEPQ